MIIRLPDYIPRNQLNPQQSSARAMPTNRDSDTYAQDMRAYLAEQEYADYISRFRPIERDYVNRVMNPVEDLDERLSKISINNRRAVEASAMNRGVMMGRYGISDNNAEASFNQGQAQRTSALSEIDAKNNTRTHIADRNMSALAGGGAVRNDIRSAYGG